MRAFSKVVRALTMTTLVAGFPLLAQQRTWEFSIGGGPGAPIGDFNDGFDIGWHGLGAVSYTLPNLPLAVQVEATYAQFADATPLDLKQRLFYGTGNLIYQFRLRQTVVEPYLIGGAGVYNLDPQGSDAVGAATKTRFGVNGGAGLSFQVATLGVFFESRIHNVFEGMGTSSMQFNNFTLGARFRM